MKYKVLAPIGGIRRFPHMIGEVVTEKDLMIDAKKLIEDGFIAEISEEEADDIIEKAKEEAEKQGISFEPVNPSAVSDDQFANNVEKLTAAEKEKKFNFEPDLTEEQKAELQKIKDDELKKLEEQKADAGAVEEETADAEAGSEGVSRKNIIDALKKAGVAFNKNASKAELFEKYKML